MQIFAEGRVTSPAAADIPYVVFRWEDAAATRLLYAGNLPHPIARGTLRLNGRWRYDLILPGAEHVAIMPQDMAEGCVERWAAAWFRSVWI